MKVEPLPAAEVVESVDGVPQAELRELHDLSEFKQLEEVFAAIWRRDGPPPVTAELMRVLAYSGNYVAGAVVSGRIAAGLLGFLARFPGHPLHLHSHILGVLPELQLRGTGFVLKQHQRRWALGQGINEMTWTFDPLVRRNGYFNIGKLGAEISAYHVDFYGSMGDSINGSAASDRALAVWRLDSPRANRAATGSLPEPELEELVESGATVALRELPDGTPATQLNTGMVALCQVPADIVALRQERPALAEAWRVALRETFGQALRRGYRAVGMTRSGWYVLVSARADEAAMGERPTGQPAVVESDGQGAASG